MGTTIDNHRAVRQIESSGATLDREARHVLPNGDDVPALWFVHRG